MGQRPVPARQAPLNHVSRPLLITSPSVQVHTSLLHLTFGLVFWQMVIKLRFKGGRSRNFIPVPWSVLLSEAACFLFFCQRFCSESGLIVSQLNSAAGLKAIAVPGFLGAPCAGTLSSSWPADSTLLLLCSALVPGWPLALPSGLFLFSL